MRKFRSLTMALLKNNMNFISDGKEKQSKSIAMGILLLVCFIPLAGLLYAMFAAYFEAYGAIAQSGTVLAVGFFLCAFVVFFFSIFIIPGVFYFSKDNNTLLCLPIKPQMILAAKFTNCLLYDYAVSFFVTIPLGIAYARYLPFGIWECLCLLLVAFTLPIIPLTYSSILTMLIMRFVPFVKNKDVFNMISGIFIVVAALGFSLYTNTLSPMDQTSLLNMVMEGNNSLIALFTVLFPFVSSASYMVINADVLQLLLYVAWNIGCVAIFLILGKYMYFKGAIGINESSSKSLKIDIRKNSYKTPVLRAYAMKEFKLLYRTPVYFTNCILTILIVPFLFIITIFQPGLKETMSSFPIENLTSIPQFTYYAVLVIIGICLFCIPLTSISQTAISREGDHASFMKFIPVSYETQIYAKAIVGIIICMISLLPVWIVLMAYFKFPLMLMLFSLLGMLFSTIALNLIGILIDVSRPKLIWEQEIAAVKQNLNAVLPMLVSVVLCVIIGVGIIFLPVDFMLAFMIAILFMLLGLILACRYIIKRYASKMFEKIQ